MREIKFQAWDRVNKRMFSFADLERSQINLYQLLSTNDYDYLTTMQYTGLHDRNGKEIYEGDILAGNWIVVWHEAGFYLHIPKLFTDTLYMPMSEKQECEVIGNIYENPELVKGSHE